MGEITVLPKRVLVYKCERSSFWQMRYRLPSGEWERRSTKTTELDEAKAIALEDYQTELIKEKSGIPSSKKTLKYFAEKQIENLNRTIEAGQHASKYNGYIQAINKWIIPILGDHKIGSINATAIKQFEQTREELHKGPVSKSLINAHNVILRGILRLAVEQRYIKSSDIPLLTTKGKGASRRSRPPFSSDEIFTMKRRFYDWVEDAIGDDGRLEKCLPALSIG